MLDWYEVAQHRAPMPAHDLAKHDVVSDEDSEGADTMAGEPSESEAEKRAQRERDLIKRLAQRAGIEAAGHSAGCVCGGFTSAAICERKRKEAAAAKAAELSDPGASKRRRVCVRASLNKVLNH